MASYDKNRNYMEEINQAVARGDYQSAASLERERNAKIAGEGMTQYQQTHNYDRISSYSSSGSGTASDPKHVSITYSGISGVPRYGYSMEKPGISGVPKVLEEPQQTPSFSYDSAPVYVNKYQDLIDQLTGRIMEQDPFSYDAESDPLYQQYRTSYTRGGERAMQNTMGQLAARTGGMASSYAGSTAQQTYDSYMSALADKIPQLQQLAYEMYQDEGEKQRLNLQMISALENNDYAKYQDLLAQYNTDRSFSYNQYRDQIADDRYADETAYNRGIYADERDYNRGIYADERDYNRGIYADETAYNRGIYADETAYNRGMARAKLLAQSGDFSGYEALGYSEEEIKRMQAAFLLEHPEYASLYQTGGSGVNMGSWIGADSMGNTVYYNNGVGTYSDGTPYTGGVYMEGAITGSGTRNYDGGGTDVTPWNKWADVEDWASKYGFSSADNYIKEHYKQLGYTSQSTALAGWRNHLMEMGTARG